MLNRINKIKILLTFMIFSLLAACYDATPVKNNVSLADLPLDIAPSIISSHIFDLGPLPRTKILHYQATNVATGQPYSTLEINLIRTKNHITEYESTEQLNDGETVKARSIAFGGVAPFKIEKQKWQNDKLISSKYIKFIDVSDISGRLFPLAVGNEIRYSFSKTFSPDQKKIALGNASLSVIGKANGFTYNNNLLPGDIFIIQYKEQLNDHAPEIKAQYYFSTKLNWFVQVIEYSAGKPVKIYNLFDTLSSLAFKKPGQH